MFIVFLHDDFTYQQTTKKPRKKTTTMAAMKNTAGELSQGVAKKEGETTPQNTNKKGKGKKVAKTAQAVETRKPSPLRVHFSLSHVFETEEAKAWYLSTDSLGSGIAPADYIPIFGAKRPEDGPRFGIADVARALNCPLSLDELKLFVQTDGGVEMCSYTKVEFQPVKFAMLTRKYLDRLYEDGPAAEDMHKHLPFFNGSFIEIAGRRYQFSGGMVSHDPRRKGSFWSPQYALLLAGRHRSMLLQKAQENIPQSERQHVPWAMNGHPRIHKSRKPTRFEASQEFTNALNQFAVSMGLASPEGPKELRVSESGKK